MKIGINIKFLFVLVCSTMFSGCGTIKDLRPVLGFLPSATSTQTSTPTPTVTQTNTLTPTFTATATRIPVKDRDLSAIILQLSELPDGFRDVTGWSGPGCMSEVDKDYPEVHTNLVHGYARDFISGDGKTFIASSLFVYGDTQSAENSYWKITGGLKGKDVDIPAVGSERTAKLTTDPNTGTSFLDVVWRDEETVLDLIYLGKEDPVMADIHTMVNRIQARIVSPASAAGAPSSSGAQGSGRIAFENSGDVFVINADGTGLTCIIHQPHNSFSFSPDGKKVAFESSIDKKTSTIQIINSDGTGLKDLTQGNAAYPKWSPDGSKIAFIDVDNGSIDTIEPNGGNRKPITDYTAEFQWYQGGKKIGLARSYPSSNWVISMDGDGANSTVIAKTLPFPYETCCLFSPNGVKIIYYSSTGYDIWPVKTYISIMNSDGSGKRRLTDLEGEDQDPSWSPDGTKVAFIYSYLQDIYSINADGGKPTRLTDSKFKNAFPIWSLDGQKIAYYTETSYSWFLCVMNSDGSDKKILTTVRSVNSYRPAGAPLWVT